MKHGLKKVFEDNLVAECEDEYSNTYRQGKRVSKEIEKSIPRDVRRTYAKSGIVPAVKLYVTKYGWHLGDAYRRLDAARGRRYDYR